MTVADCYLGRLDKLKRWKKINHYSFFFLELVVCRDIIPLLFLFQAQTQKREKVVTQLGGELRRSRNCGDGSGRGCVSNSRRNWVRQLTAAQIELESSLIVIDKQREVSG